MAKMSRSTRATLISAAMALGLLAVAGIIMISLPEPGPADLDEATAEVVEGFDLIEASIPDESIVDIENGSTTRACRADANEQEVQLTRVVTIDPEMDAVAWGATLSAAFPSDESWLVELADRVEQGQVRAKIVGSDLVVIRVATSVDEEPRRISMNAVSACAPATTGPAARS